MAVITDVFMQRKLPEYGLATGMLEAASGLEDKASGCKPLLRYETRQYGCCLLIRDFLKLVLR